MPGVATKSVYGSRGTSSNFSVSGASELNLGLAANSLKFREYSEMAVDISDSKIHSAYSSIVRGEATNWQVNHLRWIRSTAHDSLSSG